MQKINNVAVVGAGYMGTGILQTLALGGSHCTFADIDAATAEQAHAASVAQAASFEQLGYFPTGAADLITRNTDWAASVSAAAKQADLVIEAVTERDDAKKAVLVEAETAARDDTILASNTSSIPIAILAAALRRPHQMYGMHWFNPAQFLPSVEVIEAPGAAPSTTRLIIELLTHAGRKPVLVADTPGFVANRLQMALFKEAALMVDEGVTTPARLDEVVRGSFGYRLPFFGPFEIADMAGLDVYAAIYEILERELGERFACPPSLRRLVDSDRLGVKTGAGYGEFDPAQRTSVANSRDRAYVTMAATLNQLREGGQQK